MKVLIGTWAMITTLQAAALAQEPPKPQPPAEQREEVPATQQPRDAPPPPPAALPKPPAEPAPADPQQEKQGGQWVHTEQYGWVWMPYGDRYTHLPPGGSSPYMYVYGPTLGWSWVAAPWLWGWGPSPYFGVIGPRYYGWFGIGLGRWYGFGPIRSHRGWAAPRVWHGGHWAGRGGFRGGGRGGVRR